MKTSVKYGFLFALIWIIVNMVIFYLGFSRDAFLIMIMFNLFFLLSSISVGLYMTKREADFEKGIFLNDFKTSMQGGFVYAIMISAFIFLYHSKIDSSIRDGIIAERVEFLHQSVPDSKTYKELQAGDPSWQGKSYDDYIENQEDQISSVVSATAIFIMHLMGLSMLAFLYSFGSTIIIRKVVLRGIE
jgi:Protein of unknown function (DUF4199)